MQQNCPYTQQLNVKNCIYYQLLSIYFPLIKLKVIKFVLSTIAQLYRYTPGMNDLDIFSWFSLFSSSIFHRSRERIDWVNIIKSLSKLYFIPKLEKKFEGSLVFSLVSSQRNHPVLFQNIWTTQNKFKIAYERTTFLLGTNSNELKIGSLSTGGCWQHFWRHAEKTSLWLHWRSK